AKAAAVRPASIARVERSYPGCACVTLLARAGLSIFGMESSRGHSSGRGASAPRSGRWSRSGRRSDQVDVGDADLAAAGFGDTIDVFRRAALQQVRDDEPGPGPPRFGGGGFEIGLR